MTSNSKISSSSSSSKKSTSIYWYRNALRFHDNPSLLAACKQSDSLLPLFVVDPETPFAQTANLKPGCIRANFVLESMREVDGKLRSMNPKSQLVVVVGRPEQVLPQVVQAVGATDLYYEQEAAAPVRELDRAVWRAMKADAKKNAATQTECAIHGHATHTLHPMEHYLARCKDGVAPSSYGVFTKMFNKMTVPPEVDDVTQVPPLPKDALKQLAKVFGEEQLKMPTLKDLGYNEDDLKNRKKGGVDFDGGEDFALALLKKMMSRTQWVATFEKPKTSPNALTVDTTGLSPCKCLYWRFVGWLAGWLYIDPGGWP